MKKLMIIALILVGALLIPAASAEILEQTVFGSHDYTTAGGYSGIQGSTLVFYDIQNYKNLGSVFLRSDVIPQETKTTLATKPYYDQRITAKSEGKTIGEGNAYYNALWSGGQVSTLQRWVEFDWFDPGTLTGTKDVVLIPESGSMWNGLAIGYVPGSTGIPTTENPIIFRTASSPAYTCSGLYVYDLNSQWFNEIYADEQYFTLNRTVSGTFYSSNLSITDQQGSFGDTSTKDIKMLVFPPYTWTLDTPYGKTFSGTFGDGGDTPTDSTVTVYIRNSQTGALLANAHIEIQDTTTDPWTEVVNQTLTSGQGTISLPKDPGIHFTQYRIGATVPGYQQVVAALFFRVTGPTNVVVEMEPLTGAPADENNTFVTFYVRDISANPIANANIQVDGQLQWTNAQGYTQFEVPKNASYPYSVTKTGYLTIEGIATVGSDDRYVVNVALMAGAVPTQPTVSPTITVEPTPTQTTPPIQEVSIIGLSVKGLAKGFGIDYDTALLMFGLMIIFGAGGMVMSSVKGGAMEFIAGSIVGTFVAFALGLIPIWIFIIIAVVFGAYVLRVFVHGGQ